MHVRIEEEKNLIRDVSNRAILNTNHAELEAYYAQRSLMEKKKIEEQMMKDKVNKLEEDITEIKSMLREVIQMRTTNGN